MGHCVFNILIDNHKKMSKWEVCVYYNRYLLLIFIYVFLNNFEEDRTIMLYVSVYVVPKLEFWRLQYIICYNYRSLYSSKYEFESKKLFKIFQTEWCCLEH